MMIASNSVTTLLDHFNVVALMAITYPLMEGIVQISVIEHVSKQM